MLPGFTEVSSSTARSNTNEGAVQATAVAAFLLTECPTSMQDTSILHITRIVGSSFFEASSNCALQINSKSAAYAHKAAGSPSHPSLSFQPLDTIRAVS